MNILEEVLSETKAKPISKIGGTDVYTYAEGQKVNRLHLAEEKIEGKRDELAPRETVNGLYYKETRCRVKVMNPDRYFMNRVRKTRYKNKKCMELVNDYRAITDQKSGRIYTPLINTFIVGKEDGKYKLLAKSTVTDKEFCSEFTSSLDTKDAEIIFSAIREQNQAVKKTDSLDEFFA